MEGLDNFHQIVAENENTQKVLNKLRISVNQHCDRISNEVNSVSSRRIEVLQENINKNTLAMRNETLALKKAAEEEILLEGRDKRIQENFEKRVEFIETCKSEIEQLQIDLVRHDKQHAQKRVQDEDKLLKLKAEVKEMSKISGVCWDYNNCNQKQLKGYVVSKIHTRIKPFEFSLDKLSSADVAEELWTLVKEVNCN